MNARATLRARRAGGARTGAPGREDWSGNTTAAVAAATTDEVLDLLGTTVDGLTSHEALRRIGMVGPNTVRTQRTRWWIVLGRQLHSALFLLLIVTATLSYFLGSKSDAVIIAVILSISIGLGFVNEFRAELAAEALHTQRSWCS